MHDVLLSCLHVAYSMPFLLCALPALWTGHDWRVCGVFPGLLRLHIGRDDQKLPHQTDGISRRALSSWLLHRSLVLKCPKFLGRLGMIGGVQMGSRWRPSRDSVMSPAFKCEFLVPRLVYSPSRFLLFWKMTRSCIAYCRESGDHFRIHLHGHHFLSGTKSSRFSLWF